MTGAAPPRHDHEHVPAEPLGACGGAGPIAGGGLTGRGNRAGQLARNAFSGAVRYAIAAVLALVVTPYALHVLGTERYGVWALAGAVMAIAQLLDLGLGRSVVRAVAEDAGRGESDGVHRTLGAGRAASLALAVGLLAMAIVLARPIVAGLFRVPEALRAEATLVVVGTAAVAALQIAFAPFQATLDGLGRMDLTNAIDAAQRIASSLGVVFVLAMGWGLAGLVGKNMVTAAVAGLAYWWTCRRRLPCPSRDRIGVETRRIRALLGFGRHVQVVNLGAALVEPVAKSVLSRAAGLDALALFELAWRLVGMLSSLFMALTAALFPAAAARYARTPEVAAAPAAPLRRSDTANDRPVIELLERAARWVGWLAAPAYLLLVALAASFVAAWLGPSYGAVSGLVRILALGWLPAVLSVPAFLTAQASGRERLATASSLVTTAVAATGAAIGGHSWGAAGVAAGVALGLAAGAVSILWLTARSYGCPALAAPVGRWTWASALCGTAVSWFASLHLPASWLGLALGALAGLATYGSAMLVSRQLGPAQMVYLWSLVRPGD